MTASAAFLRHSTPARTRIEIPSLKGRSEKLARIANEMANLLEGVETVKMNPSIGTLTVFHAPYVKGVLLEESRSRQWFDVQEALTGSESQAKEVTELVREQAQRFDRQLKVVSGNRLSAKTLVFFSLIGLGVLQMRRGKTLPAGLTLMMQATAFMNGDDADSGAVAG